MDSSLTEKQELILFKAVKDNKGVVQLSTALAFYSSKSSAQSAIKRLKLLDYIEKKRNRVNQFDVKKVPPEVGNELDHVLDDEDSKFDIEQS